MITRRDILFLGGDILAAMAEGVEKSDIIIMFLSGRYKDSCSCRSGNTTFFFLDKN